MATLALAWCVLCALTARKPAHGHGHGHGQKAEKNEFWRKLRHKGGCCCFGWAVYAPWVCYMDIWALCNPKPPKCALTCQADLAADPSCKSQDSGHKEVELELREALGVLFTVKVGSRCMVLCFYWMLRISPQPIHHSTTSTHPLSLLAVFTHTR